MLRFEPGKASNRVYRGGDVLGWLWNDGMWEFKANNVIVFTADELRQIADELDRLNRAGEGK